MAYTTIDDPSEYFTTLLYTGNATDNRNLTNDGNSDLQPDFIWLKERTGTSSHQLVDSTRGSSFAVMSDSNAVEDEDANRVQAFQTNGFQVGTASTVNQNTITNLAFQWKVNGGTTSTTHSNGATNKVDDNVLQVNTTAGIAIVTYTGVEDDNGNSPIFVHNLGGVAEFVLVKNRSQNDNWAVLHKDISASGGTKSLILNNNAAASTDPDPFDGNAGASNGVYVKGQPSAVHEVNADGESYVAYCFRSIQGYSKIGSYTGNGSTNGAFVYTGFKPAWILFRRFDAANNWYVMDNKRNPSNPLTEAIGPDRNNAEIGAAVVGAAYNVDLVSNGFKFRTVEQSHNGNGSSYIYMAFAEHPFVSSKGAPVTAR